MSALVVSLGLMALVPGLSELWKRTSIDLPLHVVSDVEERWIQWGRIELNHHQRWTDYFFIRLPSYSWQPIDYGRHFGWCQRVLFHDSVRGWQIFYRPCPELK